MNDATPEQPADERSSGAAGDQPEHASDPTRPPGSTQQPTQPHEPATQPMTAAGAQPPGTTPPGASAVPAGAVPAGAVPPPGSVPPGSVPPGAVPPAVGPAAGEPVAWHAVGPPPPRRSVWREATSTTGGKIAIVASLVAIALVGLSVTGFVIGAILHHNRFDTTAGPGLERGRQWQVPKDRMWPNGPPGMDRRNRADDGLPRLGGPLGSFDHGEFTVTAADGSRRTLTIQRGTVTKASSSSITVRSSDNFTATYSIDSSTRLPRNAAPTTNDRVVVLADKDSHTALRIERGGVLD